MIEATLELCGIAKRFGPVHALRGADFILREGEVHALLGENGAGKSTLMHVAYGLIRPDAGTMRVRGHAGFPRSPRQALKLGIGMVHQHFTAIPALTVAENVALAAGWGVQPAVLRSRVEQLMQRSRLPLDPSARAGDLSVALTQRLEILKALAGDAAILLLDEPTAVLAPVEAEGLLALARRFAADGGSVVLITHKLDEALRAADEVTVLRSGRVTLTGRAAEQTPRALAGAMVGAAELGAEPSRRAAEAPGGGVEVSGVSYALFQNLSPGYGFSAIAVALLARLQPLAIVVTGVIFGALEAGAAAMQRDAGIPAVAAYVVEGVVILALLLADAAARRARSTVILPDGEIEPG